MKFTITIKEDVITAKLGTYFATVKADVPEDPRDCIETLLSDHIIYDLLEDLAHEII